MKKKAKKLYNPHQSVIYQIEEVRNKSRRAITHEYLIFLINLYGNHIETGDKRIKDYYDMTMLDVRNELLLRIKMMRGETNSRIRKHKEEQQRKQDELLRRLSQMG